MKRMTGFEGSIFGPGAKLLAVMLAAGTLAWSVALPGTARAAGNLSASDMAFLVEAAQAGNAEVMASRLVRSKNTSQEVKSFASQILADHTRIADQLKKLAVSKGVELPADNATTAREQQKITQLSSLDGKEFDRKFTEDIGVKAHRDAVELFDNAARTTKDRDIERFASANLPSLKHHLQMAEDFSKKVSMK